MVGIRVLGDLGAYRIPVAEQVDEVLGGKECAQAFSSRIRQKLLFRSADLLVNAKLPAPTIALSSSIGNMICSSLFSSGDGVFFRAVPATVLVHPVTPTSIAAMAITHHTRVLRTRSFWRKVSTGPV